MRRVVKRVVTFKCETCGTEHKTVRDAKKCEKRTLEIKTFTRGDKVFNREPRQCGKFNHKKYIFSGVVVRVIGPMASDYEYEVKWLGGANDRVNGHVYQYEVRYTCPHCRESRGALYYAPELRRSGQ